MQLARLRTPATRMAAKERDFTSFIPVSEVCGR
jgi:hypothetical protein